MACSREVKSCRMGLITTWMGDRLAILRAVQNLEVTLFAKRPEREKPQATLDLNLTFMQTPGSGSDPQARIGILVFNKIISNKTVKILTV